MEYGLINKDFINIHLQIIIFLEQKNFKKRKYIFQFTDDRQWERMMELIRDKKFKRKQNFLISFGKGLFYVIKVPFRILGSFINILDKFGEKVTNTAL